MTQNTYDQIWDNIIIPIFNNICGNNDFISLKQNKKKKIYAKYLKTKNKVKTQYMADQDKNIDRHKIAAIFLKVIEEVSPIYISKRYIFKLYKENKTIEDRYFYANEILAFYTGLSIISNFMDYDVQNGNNNRSRYIIIPETFNNSDYAMNTCVDIYFSKQSGTINVLTFANVFFLLEKISSIDNISIS